jgi:Molecular chaperone (small heat shock protein)
MAGLADIGRSAVRNALERVGRGVSRVQERRPLAHDFLESEDAYLVVFDAPGVSREDVQVKFSSGTVEIRVDRFRDFYDGFEMRFPGRGLTLSGSATLPREASVSPQEATATITQAGTLRVEIPKDETSPDVTVADSNDE